VKRLVFFSFLRVWLKLVVHITEISKAT